MKDNNNLSDFNTWSGTEYNNNFEGFDKTQHIQLIPSKEWSNIGENSLKIFCTSVADFIETPKFTGLNVGDTFTFSLVIYNPIAQVRCRLKSSNNSNITTITVPPSDNSKKISVTGVIPSNYGYMGLRMFIDGIGSCYIDDICTIVS